jgi:hypothetical protein
MKELAILLRELTEAGVITNDAVFGAVAQMRYTEPVATLDVDVLVEVPGPDRLDVLTPIYEFCRARNFVVEGECIRVGAWPVRFIPVFSPLTAEALRQARETSFEGAPIRVVGADHLAVIALSVGRSKDFERVLALLNNGSASRSIVEELAVKHGLTAAWQRFQTRFLNE